MKALQPLTLATLLLLAPACDDETSPMADAGAPGPDGGGSTADAGPFTMSSGEWLVYDVPDAGRPAMGITGSAAAFDLGGKTRVTLSVSGLAPSTTYGSHVHKLACSEMMAGGHYQDKSALAADAAVTDEMYANVMNEIWLDFTTDAAGKGMAERTVDFKVRPGEAKAIVVHKMMTGMGGLAGPKLACLNIAF